MLPHDSVRPDRDRRFGVVDREKSLGVLLAPTLDPARNQPTRVRVLESKRFVGVGRYCDIELVTLAITGTATITFMSTANATVQLTTRPEMRGRVMSIYMLLFLGSTPIGGPIMGWISGHFGARWSLAAGEAEADLVALGRKFLDDPRWTWHAARELGVHLDYPGRYHSCHPALGSELRFPEEKAKTDRLAVLAALSQKRAQNVK